MLFLVDSMVLPCYFWKYTCSFLGIVKKSRDGEKKKLESAKFKVFLWLADWFHAFQTPLFTPEKKKRKFSSHCFSPSLFLLLFYLQMKTIFLRMVNQAHGVRSRMDIEENALSVYIYKQQQANGSWSVQRMYVMEWKTSLGIIYNSLFMTLLYIYILS